MGRVLKELGYDERWIMYKLYYRDGYYNIKQTIDEYIIEIDTTDSSDYIRLLFWNENIPQISIDVNKKMKLAVMSPLLYELRLRNNGQLENEESIRDLYNFIFKFLKIEMNVDRIQTVDDTRIKHNNEEIHLLIYSLLTRSCSWYEDYFNFYPIEEHEKRNYISAKNNCKLIPSPEYNSLTKITIDEYAKRIGYSTYECWSHWQKDL